MFCSCSAEVYSFSAVFRSTECVTVFCAAELCGYVVPVQILALLLHVQVIFI